MCVCVCVVGLTSLCISLCVHEREREEGASGRVKERERGNEGEQISKQEKMSVYESAQHTSEVFLALLFFSRVCFPV